ncbi:MAG: tandem-95 repeat protein [Cyanobacteria bacterium J06582_2]
MTLENLLSNLIFSDSYTGRFDLASYPFPDDGKELIREYVTYLYNESSIAREILDELDEPLNIYSSDELLVAREGGIPSLFIDKKIFDNTFAKVYISETGTVVQYDNRLALMHEFVHVIRNLDDEVNFDSQEGSAGDTQNLANTIHDELGVPRRISYLATFTPNNIEPTPSTVSYRTGTEFTEGNQIDIAHITFPDFDQTAENNPPTRDLIIVTASSGRKISTGGGNDYIYGFKGDDTLNGGADDDYIDGKEPFGSGDDADVAVYRGSHDEYNIEFLDDGEIKITDRVAGRDGSDRLFNMEFGQFADKKVKLEPGLDIAFVIDTTGSMGSSIGAVQSSATQIINSIFDTTIDSRIAVVGYNDPGTNTFLSFTNQPSIEDRKSAARSAINSVGASGGGDFPEAVNAGLIRALNGGAGEWRADASARRIILFGDAPPKDTELRAQVLSLAAGADVSTPSAAALAPASIEPLGFVPLSIEGDIETSRLSDGLAMTTFALETADAEGATVTVPVEIFTILVGGDPTTGADFESLADATGGQAFSTNASGLVDSIIKIIETPTGLYFTTDEDTSVVIQSAELLDSDTGEVLSLVEISNSYNGTAVINADGNIEFTPDANFNGKASFDYTVTNGTDTSTRFADVVVNSVNDILIVNNDVATADEDTSITLLASDLFDNDVNDDREESRISGITNLVGGTAFVDSDGNIELTPDSNFNGIASFDYTVTDGVDNETASVEVTVNPVNDAPIASNDTATAIDEDTSFTILATELLSNDSDVEGDSLSIIEVNSSDGTAVINTEGNIEFTPAPNFNGTAKFNYIVTDSIDNSTASVDVVVNPINDILVANNDVVVTNKDTLITIQASDLFANDINDDIEKSLNISQITNAVNGTAVIDTNGNVVFTPDTHFYGIASFDYTVTEGTDIETASVEVLVNSVDDAPIGNNDTATTDEDTAIAISATQLLSNDINYDPEDSLSVVNVGNSANGTAVINSDGNVEFAPDDNFFGTASFDYTVTDGKTDTTASVAVSVAPINDPLVLTTPIPNLTVGQNAPNTIIMLSDYFEDVENGDQLGYSVKASATFTGGTEGKFFKVFDLNSANKSLTLDFEDGTVGTATIFVTATDSGNASVETSFTVTVEDTVVESGLNDDTVTTDEDTSVTILAADLLSNDTGDNLSVVGVENAVNGMAVLNEDGNIEFTPDDDFNGTASFDYLASDGTETKTASVEVTVNAVNDTLTTTSIIPDITVGKNAPNTLVNLQDYFTDADGADDISYSVKTSSSFTGSSTGKFYDLLSLNSTTGLLTLDYENNVVGTSTVTVTATDGGNESVTTSFTVTVTDTVIDTGLNSDSIATDEDTSVTVLASELLSNDIGSNLSLIGVENAVNGTVFLNEAGEIEFTPDPNFNGTASFDYIVSDGTQTDTALVEVTVNPINDVPVLTKPIANFTVTKNAPNSVVEIANYFDDVENGNNLAYSFGASSSFSGGNGKFFDSFSSNPVTKALTLDYADDVIGTSTIRVTATDSGNESVETSFTVSVIDSTANDDSLSGGDGDDYLVGLSGDDSLRGNRGNDSLYGSSGNDTLRGHSGNDLLNGGDGDDSLYGSYGNDTLAGGAGSDRILEYGNINFTLTDTSLTGRGNDTLSQIELARLQGGAGDNSIDATGASSIKVTLDGAAGNDTLAGGSQSDLLMGRAGDDSLRGNRGNDTLVGSHGNDVLRGHSGNDLLNGGDGDDSLFGSYGNDTLAGGAGSDRILEYGNVNFTLTDTSLTGLGVDTLDSIELANLYGRDGANLIDATAANNIATVIKGEGGDDTLMGSQMSDSIFGGSGNDVLYGSRGNDTLIGNSGADVFVIESAAGMDTIQDFEDGVDSFGLTSLSFSDLSVTISGAGVLIIDTTDSDQILARVDNITAAQITADDFTSMSV